MSVIPNSSLVIAWDYNSANQALGTGNGSAWPQRWAVGDPETGAFTNFTRTMPVNLGDLFCSGHTWLPDGRLFVAGGNTRYPTSGAQFYEGSQYAGIWDPSGVGNNAWSDVAPMRLKRWYPTVTLIVDAAGDHLVMVSGGVENTMPMACQTTTDRAFNTYEVFNIASNDWERDATVPGNPPRLHGGVQNSACFQVLGEYPRMHALSNNQVFVAGMWSGSCRVRHDSSPIAQNPLGDWLEPWQGAYGNGSFRNYGSSVLVPNVGRTVGGDDLVMILGGGYGGSNSVHDTSRVIDGAAIAPIWGTPEVMQYKRMCANAVLLPNGHVLVVGGSESNYFQSSPPNPTPVFEVEYHRKGLGWKAGAAQQSPRMYHSTAVLLPSGKVVSAGGDIRTSDYELYTPDCIQSSRPSFAGAWATPGHLPLQWDTLYQIPHDPYRSV
jgi:hypothetical protein